MRVRVERYNNKALFWHAATTHAVLSLMAGLSCSFFLENLVLKPEVLQINLNLIQRYIAISKCWIQCLFFQKNFQAHFLGKFVPQLWRSPNYRKFGTGVHCYMLITILVFIFPKFWSLMFFWEIWSHDLDSSKLTEIL